MKCGARAHQPSAQDIAGDMSQRFRHQGNIQNEPTNWTLSLVNNDGAADTLAVTVSAAGERDMVVS